MEVVREANINVLVGDRRMPVLEELNETAISIEEVRETVKGIKLVRHQVLIDFQWNIYRKMI